MNAVVVNYDMVMIIVNYDNNDNDNVNCLSYIINIVIELSLPCALNDCI